MEEKAQTFSVWDSVFSGQTSAENRSREKQNGKTGAEDEEFMICHKCLLELLRGSAVPWRHKGGAFSYEKK